MGAITEDILREIDERHARHAGRPDLELIEHLLVAVQRERVAAVGYDTARLGERLRRAALPDGVRRAIARVIGQIWLDETMHARYVLGVLLRQRCLGTQLGAMMQSTEGGVGGWMTAVEQHTTWDNNPAERLAAALIDIGGRLSGRIPDSVKSSLTYGPLRAWCEFSRDAEESAVLGFSRMRALEAQTRAFADSVADLPDGLGVELARMERDELTHVRVFETLARALADDDGLAPGVDAEALIAELSACEPGLSFAEALSRDPSDQHVIGRGGVVVVARGDGDADKLSTLDRALEDSRFFERAERRAAERGRRLEDARVVVKIDLMLAWHRSDPSSYTDPELVEHLAKRLWERGFRDIAVCDAQNVYGRYYANRTVEAVGRYVGLGAERYRLVDLSLEQVEHEFARAMGVYSIGRSWRDADVRVSFAKLKSHPTAVAQLALRNVGAVIPQTGEHFFADRLTDFTALMVGLLHDMPPDFALVDGYAYAADGLIGVMADPTPKHPRIIVAGADAFSVDHVTLRLTGERDPMRASDLRACREWFGDPSERITVVGDLTPIADWEAPDAGVLSAPLAALAGPVYASLSGRGAWITADMDPVAFPAIGETTSLALTRRMMRALLGMGRRRDA